MPYYRCAACGAMSHSVAAYSTAGVCAVCSAPLPDEAKLDSLPELKVELRRSMRAGLAAPAEARSAVVSLPLIEATRDKLALLVSELVTNSIRHAGLRAGDPIHLDVMSQNGHLRVAVHDAGPGFDPSGRNGHAPSNGGFGLASWRPSRRNGASSAAPTASPSGARCPHDAPSPRRQGVQARYRRVRTTRSPARVRPAILTWRRSPGGARSCAVRQRSPSPAEFA